MKLRQRTQTELDIEDVEKSADTFLNAIKAAVISLNNAYNTVWSLPDERLVEVLQSLLDNGELTGLLEHHHFAATYLNSILQRGGVNSPTAISTVAKPYIINDDGRIVLTPTEESI